MHIRPTPEGDFPVTQQLIIGKRVIADATHHRLSRHLLFARINAGLLQRQVAQRMGTTTSAVSRVENAAGHAPTLKTLEQYAAAVGCTLDIRLVPLRR